MLSQVPAHGAGPVQAAAGSGGAQRTPGSAGFVQRTFQASWAWPTTGIPGAPRAGLGPFQGLSPADSCRLVQAGMQTIPSVAASALQAQAGAAQVTLDILSFHL